MSFARVVRRTWDENMLFSVLLELTYRCNLDCFFCYNDRSLDGRPLAFEQYERLLRDLRELGTLNLVLSGGEPLAHADFWRIGARARDLGFLVRVKSNGHALRERVARRLRDEIDPFVIEVSLHGASAATHDRQTRVPGSFERLLSNLQAMTRLGLRLKLNSTLTAWNEHEIEGMYAIADSLGVALQFDPDVTPRDDGDRTPRAIAASVAGLRRLAAVQQRRSAAAHGCGQASAGAAPVAAPGKHCGAGSSTLAIDPYGNVYPCVQWRRPVGNLHDDSIHAIWAGSQALQQVRRETAGIPAFLATIGDAGRAMAYCPGAAETEAGCSAVVYGALGARLAALADTGAG